MDVFLPNMVIISFNPSPDCFPTFCVFKDGWQRGVARKVSHDQCTLAPVEPAVDQHTGKVSNYWGQRQRLP